jgi:peptidyl-prolyl cis-trans isomerase SurA
MRRAARAGAVGVLLAAAVSTLAACRTSPDVAAYIGDETVTVAQLEAAVDERLADEDVASYAADDPRAFTRRVLGLLVEREVSAAAAERYDVQVGDRAVRSRIDELLGDDDPADVYRQLAQQGIGRGDVTESIRQQLVREEVAAAAGQGDALSDEALRERYDEVRADLAQIEFGYIAVPDAATGAAVLAQLTADPAGYPAVAAQHPGQFTLGAVTRRGPDQLPPVMAEQLAAAAPGTGFTVEVSEVGTVVGFVTAVVEPTFEELRPQLEADAGDEVAEAGAALVDEVREDLDVTVNPRYGVLQDGRLVEGDGGVVEILGRGGDDGAEDGRGD